MTMHIQHMSLRTVAIMATGAACAVFGGSYLARAKTGSAISSPFVFAGVLTRGGVPLTGTQVLRFSFKVSGVPLCESPELNVAPDENGRFRTVVPTAGCAASLFDGRPVTYDIFVGGALLASNESVYPVPVAKHAEQVGTPECPIRYARDRSEASIIVCRRGLDEVVRVGSGTSAFWVDRYEASVWDSPDADGTQYGLLTRPVYPAAFPANGQGQNDHMLYAASVAGVLPSTGMTWFQAERSCRASGKRLLTTSEWFAAAAGTPDSSDVDQHPCNVSSACPSRPTGSGRACASDWGAEDQNGNIIEWTSEWAGGITPSGASPGAVHEWPAEYGQDGVWNLNGLALPSGSIGLPVAIQRGGACGCGITSGVFAYSASSTPMYSDLMSIGFRCLIPR